MLMTALMSSLATTLFLAAVYRFYIRPRLIWRTQDNTIRFCYAIFQDVILKYVGKELEGMLPQLPPLHPPTTPSSGSSSIN